MAKERSYSMSTNTKGYWLDKGKGIKSEEYKECERTSE